VKILSIDGGGIKGLYSAAFLANLEERFGKQVADCFDLIAGTSTGGILALALAAKIPAQKIVDFYKDWGPKIFPYRFKLLYTIRSLIFSKYNNKTLTEAFKDVFKELRMKDIYDDNSKVALCIPSINAIAGSPCVFKTQHHPNLIRDKDHFLWQIALATSAAPTFLPLAKIEVPNSSASNLFVDGGLWANNPSLVALTEALAYKKVRMEDIYLVSIGNIKSSTSFKSNTIYKKGIILWSQSIISLTLETQSASIHNHLNLIFDKFGLSDHYIRIEHPMTSGSHFCLNKLDCTTKANLNDLEILGRERANQEGVKPHIINLFKEGGTGNGRL
jgi:patatin-like phospholipase/acyl hydrolase